MTHSKKLRSILFVSADLQFQQIGSIVLRIMGNLEVHACRAAANAAEYAGAPNADLLLLDTANMDISAAVAMLRALPHWAATPILFIVPSDESGEAVRCRSLGGIGVIRKPDEMLVLPELVFQIWEAAQFVADERPQRDGAH